MNFTQRQLSIIKLRFKGMEHQEIADELHCSLSHVSHFLARTDVKDYMTSSVRDLVKSFAQDEVAENMRVLRSIRDNWSEKGAATAAVTAIRILQAYADIPIVEKVEPLEGDLASIIARSNPVDAKKFLTNNFALGEVEN
jgi:orotate phosphoribosyltransferase-like protein